MTDLTPYLATQTGFDEISRGFDSYLRAQKFTELEAYLKSYLSASSSAIAGTCLGIDAKDVSFGAEAWDNLNRSIIGNNQDLKKVAAIGFDLTGHWEGEGPGFELNLYADAVDDGFMLEGKSHAELLARAKDPAPWQGFFIASDIFSPIKGLERLYTALHSYDNQNWTPRSATPMPQGFDGYFLGLWFLHLRVQQTFARDLETYGLPRAMPVLLGTHDFTGHYEGYNVIMNSRIVRPDYSYESLMAEEAVKRRERIKVDAAEKIETYIKNWMAVRSMLQNNPNGAKASIDHLNASLAGTLRRVTEIVVSKPISEMKEAEFKALMETYYQKRMARAA